MERQLTELITGLLARGFSVTAIATDCDLPHHPRLRWIPVRAPARPFSVTYPWFFLLGTVLTARHRRGPVHTTGAIVFNRADLSTVHFCHRAVRDLPELGRSSRSGPLYALNATLTAALSRWAERYCYRRECTTCLAAVSQGGARELRRHFPAMDSSVAVIPNGVDLEAFMPDAAKRRTIRAAMGIPDAQKLAVFAGGDWERKGLDVAIEGVADADGWHLAVAGAGDRSRYMASAQRCGAAARIHFLGIRHDIASIFAAGDAFVLPTRYETFSLVTYEAAATGLPLLVTRVNGVEDILEDGVNGWFIGHDASDLSRRLGELAADERLRVRMGDAARAAAVRHPWSAMVDAYADIYERASR